MGKRAARPTEQGDLFAAAELFPVRRPVERVRPVDLSLRIKTAMGEALKKSPKNAFAVAAEISEMTGRELTADALYAYTAPTKPEHDISLTRFVAFVRATGANWLWGVLVEDDGLIVLEGREAHLAQLGLLQQEQARITDQIKTLKGELKHAPVTVRRRGRT
ncbi:hypothetical protein C3941_09245 [Kaistia algarum]|uniref:hypothetical protein n=1 Tax=Kaistia algarum TaxID=2083279 RepID=UPI000CE733FD|nr:hypothetical protein [Kaistia algarum]MCX5512244.1 hypothetical protein [Kaistia algarum]PPE80338.1 hypothetical protein C3941_09245 [Kaistia algarum]